MTLEVLGTAEIDALEQSIDDAFELTSLPADDYLSCTWVTCAGAEHLYRYLLSEVCKRWHQTLDYPDRSAFLTSLDRYKYELRQALLLCQRKAPAATDAPILRMTDDAVEAVANLLISSDQFAQAVRVFSPYRSGDSTLSIDRDSGIVYEETRLRELQYASLELHVHEVDDHITPILALITIFSGPTFTFHSGDIADWAPWLHEILDRVRERRGRLQFQISIPLASHFFDDLYAQPTDIPHHWIFPWGTADSCCRYFSALNAILFYHMFCVHFGSTKFSMENNAATQFLLKTSVRKLNEDISALTGMSKNDVADITAALTLGSGMDVADPALQPIVPIGAGTVSIPGIFTVSSNWARNLMSLHARVSPKTFSHQSSVFETRMTESATQAVRPEFARWENLHLRTRDGTEEVDLLIADPFAKTLLVCELRWMIQPGDIREVLNRQRVLREKMAQVERKCRRINSSLRDVGAQLGLFVEGWSALGLVVVDGYGGTISPKPNEFPIVPLPVFQIGLHAVTSLSVLHAILCTPLWLPRPGSDIEIERNTVEYFGMRISRDGFRIGNSRYLTSVEGYLRDASTLTPDELASVEW